MPLSIDGLFAAARGGTARIVVIAVVVYWVTFLAAFLAAMPGDVSDGEVARFERKGAMSVVPRRTVQVVEVEVRGGVQTVRLVLEGR